MNERTAEHVCLISAGPYRRTAPGRTYRATCPCGWRGNQRDLPERAGDEWKEHLRGGEDE